MKRVKDLINSSSYLEAGAEIETLLAEDDQNKTFVMYQNLGQCYAKAGGNGKKAIASYLEAMKLEPNPPVSFYKSLSECYDQEAMWNESADTLAKQYEVVRSKGNYNKALEIARMCLDRWQKTKKQQDSLADVQKSARFLHTLLNQNKEGEGGWLTEEILPSRELLQLVTRLVELQYGASDIKVQAAKGKLSSKVVETAVDSAEEELNPMCFSVSKAIQLLIALSNGSAIDDISSIGAAVGSKHLIRGIGELLTIQRSQLLSTAAQADPASTALLVEGFQGLMDTALGLGRAHVSFYSSTAGTGGEESLVVVDVCSLAVEAWLYCQGQGQGQSYEVIASAVEQCLLLSPAHIGANLAKAISVVEQGVTAPARGYAEVLWGYWENILTQARSLAGGDYAAGLRASASDRKQAFFAWSAYVVVAVRGSFWAAQPRNGAAASADYLLLSQYAQDMMAQATGGSCCCLAIRAGWRECVALSRLHVLHGFGQVAAAKREAPSLLPVWFSSSSLSDLQQEELQEVVVVSARRDAILEVAKSGTAAAAVVMVRRMLSHALLALELYSDDIALVTALTAAADMAQAPSYAIADGAYATLQQARQSWLGATDTSMYSALQDGSLLDSDFSSSGSGSGGGGTTIAGSLSARASALAALAAFQRTLGVSDAYSVEIASETQWRLGLCLWLCGGEERASKKCTSALLASAKLQPARSEVYSLLGHHYHTVGGDRARAVKLYLKALQISPFDEEAGLALSALYLTDIDSARGGGDEAVVQAAESRALKLWSDVCALTASAAWVHEVRGRYLLHMGARQQQANVTAASAGTNQEQKHEDERVQLLDGAVEDLQRALEHAPHRATSWYLLGTAHYHLGQYGSARAALARSGTLSPTCALAPTLAGAACLRSGLIAEAEAQFDIALARAPRDVVASKGAAEAALLRAHQRLAWGWPSGAAIAIQAGLLHVDNAAKQAASAPGAAAGGGYELTLWKLEVDLCAVAAQVGLTDLGDGDSNGDGDVRLTVLRRGEQRCAEIVQRLRKHETAQGAPQLARACYDLGSAMYQQLVLQLQARGYGSGYLTRERLLKQDPELASLQARALSAFTDGLRVDPSNADCWVGAGLAHTAAAVSIASLTRATQLDPAHSGAQINLALRLVAQGQTILAQEALAQVQMRESHPDVWTVTALLTEQQSLRAVLGMSMQQAHDAYCVALEVSRPAGAALGAAITFLRLRGALSDDGALCALPTLHLPRSGSSATLTVSELRFRVANPVQAHLQENPCDPGAWALLAWATEHIGQDCAAAARAYHTALVHLEAVATAAGKGSSAIESGRIAALAEGVAKSLLSLLVRAAAGACASWAADSVAVREFACSPTAEHFPVLSALSTTFTKLCALAVEPNIVSVPSEGMIVSPVLLAPLRAWVGGDIAGTAAALGVACTSSDDSEAVLSALWLLRELSVCCSPSGSELVQQCAATWMTAALRGCAEGAGGEQITLEAVLNQNHSNPLLRVLLGSGNGSTESSLDPVLWVAAVLSSLPREAEAATMCLKQWLRLALARFPHSCHLYLMLGAAGGGEVEVDTLTALLRFVPDMSAAQSLRDLVTEARGGLILSSPAWGSQECYQAALALGKNSSMGKVSKEGVKGCYQQHLPLGAQQAQSAFAVEAQALRALRVSTASHQSDALRAARLDPTLLGAALAELEQAHEQGMM